MWYFSRGYFHVWVCSTFVFYDKGDFPFKIVKSGKTRTYANGLGILPQKKKEWSVDDRKQEM